MELGRVSYINVEELIVDGGILGVLGVLETLWVHHGAQRALYFNNRYSCLLYIVNMDYPLVWNLASQGVGDSPQGVLDLAILQTKGPAVALWVLGADAEINVGPVQTEIGCMRSIDLHQVSWKVSLYYLGELLDEQLLHLLHLFQNCIGILFE